MNKKILKLDSKSWSYVPRCRHHSTLSSYIYNYIVLNIKFSFRIWVLCPMSGQRQPVYKGKFCSLQGVAIVDRFDSKWKNTHFWDMSHHRSYITNVDAQTDAVIMRCNCGTKCRYLCKTTNSGSGDSNFFKNLMFTGFSEFHEIFCENNISGISYYLHHILHTGAELDGIDRPITVYLIKNHA